MWEELITVFKKNCIETLIFLWYYPKKKYLSYVTWHHKTDGMVIFHATLDTQHNSPTSEAADAAAHRLLGWCINFCEARRGRSKQPSLNVTLQWRNMFAVWVTETMDTVVRVTVRRRKSMQTQSMQRSTEVTTTLGGIKRGRRGHRWREGRM